MLLFQSYIQLARFGSAFLLPRNPRALDVFIVPKSARGEYTRKILRNFVNRFLFLNGLARPVLICYAFLSRRDPRPFGRDVGSPRESSAYQLSPGSHRLQGQGCISASPRRGSLRIELRSLLRGSGLLLGEVVLGLSDPRIPTHLRRGTSLLAGRFAMQKNIFLWLMRVALSR